MDFEFLTKTVLFQGMMAETVRTVLADCKARQKRYKKGGIVYRTGDTIQEMGLILSGRVSIESDDMWGNRSVLDSVGPGQVFAETYACLPGEPLMVNAVAAEGAEILFLHAGRLFQTACRMGRHGEELIRNLLSVTARKNLTLSRRIFHTSPKSIRGRLLSYLSCEAARQKSREFTIPFDRQQLADYLSVDRSALSHELGRMQKDGLLRTQRNYFLLLEADEKTS